MNVRTFNRKLNFCINNEILTASSIETIIKSDKESILNNMSIEDLLKINLQKIVDNTLYDYKAEMLKYLYDFDYLKADIEKILPSIITKYNYYDFHDVLGSDIAPKVIETLNLNFEKFIKEEKYKLLFEIMTKHPNFIVDKNKNILNEYFSQNKKKLAEAISIDKEIIFHNIDEKEKNIFLDMIANLIDELVEHSHINYTDIKYIGKGAYSFVYQIGDKVFKIGTERGTYQIGNDKRLLQPLLRINLKDSFNIHGTIEITNLVDTNVNLTEEEFYSLYKELRNRGIFYTDIRMDNLGSLKSDNTYHWHEELGDDPSIRGLDRALSKEEILKDGDIVIIDSDYIYNPEQVKYIDFGNSKVKIFEKRYKKELEEEKKSR